MKGFTYGAVAGAAIGLTWLVGRIANSLEIIAAAVQ